MTTATVDAAEAPRRVEVPDTAFLVLAGPAGSGKSAFAARHFGPHDVVSSDTCRALVAGDPADQTATADAFALLRRILQARAARHRLTVVDATSVTHRERVRVLGIARKHAVPAVAVVLALPLATCQRRAAARTERPVAADVVAQQHAALERSLPALADEPFTAAVVLRREAEVAATEVVVRPAPPREPER